MPWHYTTIVDFIDHWQTLLAGLIALVAAIITVFVTLTVERRHTDREIDTLRRSLSLEIRQLIPRALCVHTSLQDLGRETGQKVTTRMVESLSRMPAPIIYLANAPKIGLLGRDAMNMVIFYQLLDTARDAVDRLMTSRKPDDISASVVLKTAEAFLCACKYAQILLPKFQTGIASHDDRDVELLQKINATARRQDPPQHHSLPA